MKEPFSERFSDSLMKRLKMPLITRVFIISIIDIVLTDLAIFLILRLHPQNLTVHFLVGKIFVTLLPIWLVLLVWYIQQLYERKHKVNTDEGSNQGLKISLPVRILIVTFVDIAATDTAFFVHIRAHPENLTVIRLIALILITLLPIWLTLLVWKFQKTKQQQ
jgi:hypothetical protein